MDLCKDASDLAHSGVLKIILIAMIIISTIAIFLEIWVMVKTTNRILVHQNTRILLILHQLWLILHCITRIFAHSYVLVAYLKTSVDQCEYMMFPWECFMIRIPASLTSNLNAASIPTLAIERAIATYFSSRYEKFGKSIAVILIIAQAVIAFGSCLYIYIDFKLLDSEKMVYCMAASNKDAPKVARFHRKKIHINLSHRYQVMENINSIQTIAPMMAFYSLFLALYLGALFAYFALGSRFSLRNTIYLESVQQTPIYALTLPIAIVWTEKYVRKVIQENLQKAMELKGTEAANHYFTVFQAPTRKNVRKLNQSSRLFQHFNSFNN
uniref:G-protein coupled receptors family 1 profile domain-containing protein n=1 Tax=Onchocerca volvulus TaxID=6282 RepID=A0A8R1XR02_ONCVO